MLWVLFFFGTKMIYVLFHSFVSHSLDIRMWWCVILVILIYFFLKATTCFHFLFVHFYYLFCSVRDCLTSNWSLPAIFSIHIQYKYSLLTRNNYTLGYDICCFRFPPQLRSMCHCLYQVLSKRFPLFPQNNIGAVGTVIFLRFINPAIGKINYILKLPIF